MEKPEGKYSCQYNDCGWCYHEEVHKDNPAAFMSCSGVEKCPFKEEKND